jgi:hypothetical protein
LSTQVSVSCAASLVEGPLAMQRVVSANSRNSRDRLRRLWTSTCARNDMMTSM